MRTTAAALFLAALAAPVARADDFFFKDGDVVVMIGDSITEQHLYSNYVEMWTVTRFPAWKLTFRNTGIGGDTSTGGNNRFRRDVLRYHPTALTVDFGMNDGGYGGFNQGRFDNYLKGLEGMAEQAKAANLRVAWITPQPLDTGDQGPTALVGYNQTLEKFSDQGVAAVAHKNGGLFVDQFHPYLAVLDKARGKAPKYQRITGGDAVHPGPAGQALMAASILKGMHFPKRVASVEIADAFRLVAAENCKVIGPELRKDNAIEFTQTDAALPFFPPDAAGMLEWTPLLEDLNDYRLKITGLNEKQKYEVRLGGKAVATFTGAELAAGVNLAAAALKEGPVADQVKAVIAAVKKKNDYHHDQIFRGIILSNVPDWLKLTPQEIETRKEAAITERLARLTELDAAVRTALEMKPHKVEIVPLPEK
jgi:lysophospholipase L1-like esterase